MTADWPLSLNDPSPGQIGLVPRPMNWFERAIENITHSKVHHVITADPEHKDGPSIISPESQGVLRMPLNSFPDAIWSDFILSEEQRTAILDFGGKQVGKPYAWGDDILIGLDIMLGQKAPDWLDRMIADDGQWQCAELADAEYNHAGINLFKNRSCAAVFPGTFAPLFKENGWWPTFADLNFTDPPVAGY